MPEVETVMRDSGKAYAFHQQPHGLHELRIIQKRLAHPHKNNVDALPFQVHLAVIEHGNDLAHDLSGAQVAFDTQQRSEAELAIHSAAYLAGDADRCPMPV